MFLHHVHVYKNLYMYPFDFIPSSIATSQGMRVTYIVERERERERERSYMFLHHVHVYKNLYFNV